MKKFDAIATKIGEELRLERKYKKLSQGKLLDLTLAKLDEDSKINSNVYSLETSSISRFESEDGYYYNTNNNYESFYYLFKALDILDDKLIFEVFDYFNIIRYNENDELRKKFNDCCKKLENTRVCLVQKRCLSSNVSCNNCRNKDICLTYKLKNEVFNKSICEQITLAFECGLPSFYFDLWKNSKIDYVLPDKYEKLLEKFNIDKEKAFIKYGNFTPRNIISKSCIKIKTIDKNI